MVGNSIYQFSEILKNVTAFIAAVAVIITALIGIVQLGKWKTEKQFDKKLDLAIDIMTVVTRFRDKLNRIRMPFIGPVESMDAIDKLKKADSSKSSIDENSDIVKAQVVIERLEKISDIRDKIDELVPLADAVIGGGVGKSLRDISSIYTTLFLDATLMSIGKPTKRSLFYNRWENMEPDEIEVVAKESIENVESMCRPIIGSNSNRSDGISGYKTVFQAIRSAIKRIFSGGRTL